MDEKEEREQPRVLLLTTARSYRNAAFLDAAERLGIEIVLAVNKPRELAKTWSNGFGVDFGDTGRSVVTITAFHQARPLKAILPVDDSGTVLAAAAADALDLPHNAVTAANATRDKLAFRNLVGGPNLNVPRFIEFVTGGDLQGVISEVGFPCVVKPRSLNGSRGVIRANDAQELQSAINRTARLIRSVQGLAPETTISLLIESYIPGREVALEGILDNGRLDVLALFDKPDPLEGPYFEETIYVTPSRLSHDMQNEIFACTAEAARQIGLVTGPVHAELRINDEGPWIVEVAGRSIGGLCSQVLKFGAGESLEEIILRQACGFEYEDTSSSPGARGVMMIPIPGAGLLRHIGGLEAAMSTPLIENVEITAPLDNPLVPLPEGDGYLGFIFARGEKAEKVEDALRIAHGKLAFTIDPLLPVLQI